MPIEFDCPSCHHRLRTPDGTEGRSAVCPKCSQQVAIPAISTPPPAISTPPPNVPDTPGDAGSPGAPDGQAAFGDSSVGGAFNPYAAPSAQTGIAQDASDPDLKPTLVTASEILSIFWKTLTDNLMHVFLLGLIMMALYIGGYMIGLPLGITAAFAGANNQVVLWTCQILNIVWGQVYGTFCAAVGIRYCLSLTAGSPEPMRGAFNVLPFFLRLIIAQVVILLMAVAAGLVFFSPFFAVLASVDDVAVLWATGGLFGLIGFVVYAVVLLRLALTSSFVIDRDLDIIDAMSHSANFTKGNTLALFLTMMVIFMLGTLFVLITCFLGAVLVMPANILCIVIVYRLVTGQSVGGNNPFAKQEDSF